MWPSNWWFEAVTGPIIVNWTKPLSSELAEQFVAIYRQQGSFLNANFFDIYLPTQSILLAFLIFLAFFGSLILLFAIGFCVAKCFGLCQFKLYLEEKPVLRGPMRYLLIAFCCFWVVSAAIWSAHCSFALEFATYNFGGHTIAAVDNVGGTDTSNSFNTEDNDEHQRFIRASDGGGRIIIGLNTVTIEGRSNELQNQSSPPKFRSNEEAESHLLRLFNDIRELGYEFKPLESDLTNLMILSSFLLTTVFYFVCLLISAIGILSGSRKRMFQSYNLMESRKSARICRALYIVGFLLLLASPIAHFWSTPFLIYSHAHNSICPYEQTLTENGNIEEYIRENYQYFDPSSLVDFLTDLNAERRILNENNCQLNIRALQGLWSSLLALSWASLPMAFCLILLSKYFKRPDEFGVNSFSKFPYNQSDIQYPNTYSTIPELVRQRQTLPTQFPFGTFVYMKQ